MASPNVPPPFSTPQTTIACAYCGEPTKSSQRITADRKLYCGKLCAALGLIRDTDDEDGIDQEIGVELLTALVEESFLDGPVRIPKKVRDCDVDAALRSLPKQFAMVVIEDDGTPDWVPELASEIAHFRAESGRGTPGRLFCVSNCFARS
jgi:hypothetical protein